MGRKILGSRGASFAALRGPDTTSGHTGCENDVTGVRDGKFWVDGNSHNH